MGCEGLPLDESISDSGLFRLSQPPTRRRTRFPKPKLEQMFSQPPIRQRTFQINSDSTIPLSTPRDHLIGEALHAAQGRFGKRPSS